MDDRAMQPAGRMSASVIRPSDHFGRKQRHHPVPDVCKIRAGAGAALEYFLLHPQAGLIVGALVGLMDDTAAVA